MNPPTTLYIVGNGFDRHHNIPSGYQDFGRYLESVDRDTYREVNTYFSVDDDFWWQFETQLANFDTDAAIDYASQFLNSYSDDDWTDSGHHDYQYELERIVKAVSATLQMRFTEWIRQLPIPTSANLNETLLQLDPSARFLNFNYTTTLQQAYNISDQQIFHIHGNARNLNDFLVLGHGWERTASDSLNSGIDLSEADTRVIEGNEIVDGYFSATFKPTNQIIAAQQPFFKSLASLRQIFVIGHSLSAIDAPYLAEIIRNIDASSVRWKISYYRDATDVQERFSGLGVDMSLVTFVRLDEDDQWIP
jgi:hypothetical protein